MDFAQIITQGVPCQAPEASLRAAIASGLFQRIRDGGLLLEEHAGGCTLYARRAEVEALRGDCTD